MTRKTLRMLLVAVLAVLTLGSIAEAGQKQVIRHRAKHSTRVSAGASTNLARKKAAATRKRAAKARTARHKATAGKTIVKHKPATKPR